MLHRSRFPSPAVTVEPSSDDIEALLELLPRFGDEQLRTATRADGWTAHDIAMHTADSNYGLALMVLGEIPPNPQINEQTGWMASVF